MFFSRVYSKSVIGLFSLIALFALAACSITFTVYSASEAAQDYQNNQSDSTPTNAATAEADENRADSYFIRRISLPSNDLIYNQFNQTIYASIPSRAGNIGNSLTQINPRTGAVVTSAYIGSEPNKIAMSGDGQTLYTSLNGANAIRRFDVPSQTPGMQFSAGQDTSNGNYLINDFAVAPDNPNVIAVVRYYNGSSPPEAGVAIFENGIQRPLTGPGHIVGSDFVTFSNTGATLFSGSYDGGFRILAIDSTGVASVTTTGISIGARIKYDDGLVFTSIGQVINANTRTLLGVFSDAVSNAFVSDKAAGKAFYVVRENSSSNNLTIKIFDINTFTPIGSIPVPNVSGDPTSLVRWGANGLAFRTTDNQIFFVQTSLLSSSEPIPTPTPTATITPTPTPTPFAAFAKQISLTANNLIYNPATAKIYASVPGSAGTTNGNSITEIDPVGATIGNSIFAGSDPNKLALADDGKTLYVGLDGAASVRKIDLSTQTAGLQISLGNEPNNGGVFTPYDIAVQPGTPNTIAVSRSSSSGIAVYDEGVRRPTTAGIGAVEFASPNVLYSGGNSSYYGSVSKLSLASNGLSVVKSIGINGGNDFSYGDNLLFTSNGKVIDTTNDTVKGTFNLPSNVYGFTVDSSRNRIYFLTSVNYQGNYQIIAFEIDTFRPIGYINLQSINGTPTSLARWGADGLAFRTSGNQVFLIRTNLVDETATIPTPTPTPTVTPTPTPVNPATFVRKINLPVNDLTYNETTQSIYASVASVAGTGTGNTISQIVPQTGAIASSVFVGSEPAQLAPADDGKTIYVRLSGINAIRKYDAVEKTAGAQFSLAGSSQFQDMDVMPNSPQTVAVTVRYDGVTVYDNGTARPSISNGGAYSINSIEFSDSPSTLYGYESESSGFRFVKFALDSSGVRGVSSVGNLISGFGVTIEYAGGLIYTSNSRVINPETQSLVGTFQSGGTAMAIDATLHRAFFLNDNVLTAYDTTTFVKIGSATLPLLNGTPLSLVRWGANGLAFRSYNSSSNTSQLYLLQSALVSESASIPTGLQLNAADYYSNEGSQPAFVTVLRTGDLSSATSVDYSTVNGTATAGNDFTAVSGTLNFAAGESSKTISIPIINDTIYEGSESFGIALANQTNNASLVYPNAATITIYDNDNQPNISSNGISVNEPPAGSTANAVFTINLSNASTQTVTVNYTTANGTATAGSDYAATSGTLTFNPLETSKIVSVPINGDDLNEPNETFTLNLSNPNNATIFIQVMATAIIRNYDPAAIRRTPFDFDGDKKSDVSVFRPSNGTWYLQRSVAGYSAVQFGNGTDKLVSADYDGDGKTDVAVWRDGVWYLQRSQLGFTGIQFGSAGDVPQPADFSGDGSSELAVFRPSNGTWYIYNLVNAQFTAHQFGTNGDKPVAADYDGDGRADLAVFRPADGVWYLLQSRNGFNAVKFGIGTDSPIVGDFDGDGKTDQAVFRAAEANWYVFGSTAGFYGIKFGIPSDLPTAGDYDGDGKTDIAVFRSENGTWYLSRSTQGFTGVQFGINGDKPIANSVVP